MRRAGLALALFALSFPSGPGLAQEPTPPDSGISEEPSGEDGPESTVGILGVLRPGSGRPDPFTLVPDTGLEPLAIVQTRPVELTGFDGPLLLTVEGGIDLVVVHNDRAFRRRRTLVMPGDVIVLSARSPLTFATTEEIVLTVGDYSTPWIISTRDQDRTPWAFDLPTVTDVPPGELAVSDPRPLRGFEGTIRAHVAGDGNPMLRLNDGPWQTEAEAKPGDQVQVSVVAPPPGQRLAIVLTLGDLQVPWIVSTPADETAQVLPPRDE